MFEVGVLRGVEARVCARQRVIAVDRFGQLLVLEAQAGGDKIGAADTGAAAADERLGRDQWDLCRSLAKDGLQGLGLGLVKRRDAVGRGHDEIHVVRRQFGAVERLVDCVFDRVALGVRGPVDCLPVDGLRRRETADFGVDLVACSPGLRRFEGFEDQNRAAFAGGGAVALGVHGFDGPSWFIIAGAGVHARELLAEVGHRVHLALGTAGKAGVRRAALDCAHALADREAARGLAAGDGVRGSAQVVDDRHVAGEHVRQVLKKPQRGQLFDALAAPVVDVEAAVFVCAGRERGRQFIEFGGDEPGPDVAPRTVAGVGRLGIRVGAGGAEAGVSCGQVGGDHRDLDVAGHDFGGLAVALGHVVADFVFGDLAADMAQKAVGLEQVDAGQLALALEKRLPERLNAEPSGRDRPQPCDADTPRHGRSLAATTRAGLNTG